MDPVVGRGPVANLILRLTTTLYMEASMAQSLFFSETDPVSLKRHALESLLPSLGTWCYAGGMMTGPHSLPAGLQEPPPRLAAPP